VPLIFYPWLWVAPFWIEFPAQLVVALTAAVVRPGRFGDRQGLHQPRQRPVTRSAPSPEPVRSDESPGESTLRMPLRHGDGWGAF